MVDFLRASPSVLVTGASGFVGRHLCNWLSERGWNVRAAVRNARGDDLNVADVVPVGAIGIDTDWSTAVAGVRAVVHLAARVHVMKESEADPLAAFRAVNVAGVASLARAAAAAGVVRFVYLSSIKVNGEASSFHPFSESDTPAPQDPYGISKWEAEQALAQVGRETGMEVVVLRPPLIYGPGVGANFLRLMRLAEWGVPLPLASVRNRRSMVYVGNLCSAIQACLEHPAAADSTFLVSDDEDVSVADLIRRMAGLQGGKDRLWPFPVPLLRCIGALAGKSAEVSRLTESLVVDSSLIRRTLNWSPPYSLAQGLAETADGYQGQKIRERR